jgi:hypothetical protein
MRCSSCSIVLHRLGGRAEFADASRDVTADRDACRVGAGISQAAAGRQFGDRRVESVGVFVEVIGRANRGCVVTDNGHSGFPFLVRSRIMRLSGVTGRWVFWQDSSRPEADFMPAYSTHRDASEKPEKEFGFFSRPDFSSLKRGVRPEAAARTGRWPLYIGMALERAASGNAHRAKESQRSSNS